MEISGSMSIAAQEMTNSRTQAGFDVLTKTLAKTEHNQENDQQLQEIAEQTGKGLNIDIRV